jgi:hypothetical protein
VLKQQLVIYSEITSVFCNFDTALIPTLQDTQAATLKALFMNAVVRKSGFYILVALYEISGIFICRELTFSPTPMNTNADECIGASR